MTRNLCSGPELIKLSYLPCALLCWTLHTNLVDHCLCDHVFADLISINNCSAHAASHCHFKLPSWLQFILKTTVTQCVAKFNQFLPAVKPLRILVNISTPETHQLFETHFAVLLVKLFQPAFSWKFWTHWPKYFFIQVFPVFFQLSLLEFLRIISKWSQAKIANKNSHWPFSMPNEQKRHKFGRPLDKKGKMWLKKNVNLKTSKRVSNFKPQKYWLF